MADASAPHDALLPASVTAHPLRDDGTFPNNAALPLLVYKQAVKLPERDPAAVFEALFRANTWGGTWRDGIYPYHHYHSTAHEVLGIARGTAQVQLGGEDGVVVAVAPGDALVIPAGVVHKNLGASGDLLVVGAYPAGQDWDMNYGEAGERPQADQNIARVHLPDSDPLYGKAGPLADHWR
jgi:uncharacterized protein YjlB